MIASLDRIVQKTAKNETRIDAIFAENALIQ
jgi:hypothetical protein